jgi:predicted dehydrogenase
MPNVRLMTVDPGHFHAALVHGEMYPEVAPRVDVFAPVGPDLVAHLHRLAAFNRRSERPTSWDWEIHAAPDYFERMLRDRPGTAVVFSGRNRAKIDQIVASVRAGLNVLADKPWVLSSTDLPKLETALAEADERGIVAYDIMTERFEATHSLQRALVNDEPTFGQILPGSSGDPAVYMESVHYLKKMVAGAPNIRPPWFFNTPDQGEGLNDVGTHLVDLVQWTLFPDQAIDAASDVEVIDAQRWPTLISEADFRSVTNAPRFPDELMNSVVDGRLEYYCNTLVSYMLRGIYTRLNVIWDWEPVDTPGDTHFAYYQGSRSRIEVRQREADAFRPELYVIPARDASMPDILAAVEAKVASLQADYPGIRVEERGSEIHVVIPDALRVGHEAHFAQVTTSFLTYLGDRTQLPAWERPNMLAKYYVTTHGTELSRQRPSLPAPRIAPR